MNRTDIDPEYYHDYEDEDGQTQEPHGYWLMSERFDIERRIWWETKQAVDEGRASWVRLEADVPFLEGGARGPQSSVA